MATDFVSFGGGHTDLPGENLRIAKLLAGGLRFREVDNWADSADAK